MMQRRIVPAAVMLVMAASACEGPQVSQPSLGPLLAKATRTAVTATVGPTVVVDQGRIWVSDGIVHIRDQVVVGPVSGDIVGTITALADFNIRVETGVGSATFHNTITTADGKWEFVCVGKLLPEQPAVCTFVAHGTDCLQGQTLKGILGQTGPGANTFVLTGEVRDPRG